MGIYNFGVILLALVAPFVQAADLHGNVHANRHHEIARRAPADIHLYKRISNSKWTFYDVEVGPGACGITNQPSDFTVALNADQFGNPSTWPGPQCFKTITLRYNGKTATATIMDKCPGCPYGGLDLTRGLFSYFDSQDKGIIYGEWWFGSDGGNVTLETTSTYVWVPPTTSSAYVWVPPTTSEVWVPPTTSEVWVSPTTSTEVWVPPTTSTYVWVPPTNSSTYVWVPPTVTTEEERSAWSSIAEASTSTWSEPSTTSSSVISSSQVESSSSRISSVAYSASATAATWSTIKHSSGTASSLAVPTGTVTPNEPQNLNALNTLFINFGGIVLAGANV